MSILNRLLPAIRWMIGLLATMLVLTSCSNMKTYRVTYKNVSTEKITEARGLWGEYLLLTGMLSPDRGFPKRGGFSNGSLQHPIPAEAGALWTNAVGERIRVEVPLDKRLFPRLNKDEKYQFVFELRQTDIRQVELVMHDKTRSKKRKVMLYCAATEANGCQFNTPFNTDTFHDSPEQKAKAQAMKAQSAAATAKTREKAKAQAKAKLKQNNW
jgi:hypothetical protein